MPLRKEQLDKMVGQGCQHPNCKDPHHEELVLAQRCHPFAGQVAKYKKGSGIITITCIKCERLVFAFHVESQNEG